MRKKLNDEIPYEEIYTKHPPKGIPSEKYLHQMKGYQTVRDLRGLIDSLSYVTLLGLSYREFKKTKNPLLLLNALMVSHESGLYPPVWVMNEIMKRLYHRYDTYEKTSLDKLFEFASYRKGKESLFKERARRHIHDIIMHDVFRLTLLGYTVDSAAEIIKRRILKEGSPKVGDINFFIEDSTIKRMYSTSWSKVFNNEHTKPIDKAWLKKNEQKFLSRFPYLPKPTKKRLL